jgi:valyl-tRNA synthetase
MLETKYDFKKVEDNKYDFWLENHLFESGNKDKTPFTIVIPPPNVTGNLHLGHALNGSIQDVIIRYKRMCGYDTLWLPGMDHAAIATEAKVVNRLKEKGINKYSLGREGFLEECWK